MCFRIRKKKKKSKWAFDPVGYWLTPELQRRRSCTPYDRGMTAQQKKREGGITLLEKNSSTLNFGEIWFLREMAFLERNTKQGVRSRLLPRFVETS
jgi:hypothetical protein